MSNLENTLADLNLTREEYDLLDKQRWEDRDILIERMKDPHLTGAEKHHFNCMHTLKYGKTLVACPKCWLLPFVCVCNRVKKYRVDTKVIVHIHHDEWGRGCNTGCLLPLSLEGCEILMKGHMEHDARLSKLLSDPEYTAAVLWPGPDSVTVTELKALAAERSNGRLAVIAIDATWNGANRMKLSYPESVVQVKLGPESTLRNCSTSLLRPIRKYKGDVGTNGRVCTLEAVAALLEELGDCGEPLNNEVEPAASASEGLLDNLRTKVDAAMTQGGRAAVYDKAGYLAPSKRRLKKQAAAAAARFDVQAPEGSSLDYLE